MNKIVLADANSKPMAVEDLAKNINDHFWYRRQVCGGTKGPIVFLWFTCSVSAIFVEICQFFVFGYKK
jgi:hypothetical protein